MNVLVIILILMLLYCFILYTYQNNIYVYYWYNSRPFKLNSIKDTALQDGLISLNDIYKAAESICGILHVEIPSIYLIENMEVHIQKNTYGCTKYHVSRYPDVYLYYRGKDTIKVLAHELYHVHQYKYSPERYMLNKIRKKANYQNEIEATAFAIAYIESKRPDLKVSYTDWEHECFSDSKSSEKEIREKIAEYKKKYFNSQRIE